MTYSTMATKLTHACHTISTATSIFLLGVIRTPIISLTRKVSAVRCQNARAIGGPKTAKGTGVNNTRVLYGSRRFIGTSSPRTTEKESCGPAAMLLRQFAASS